MLTAHVYKHHLALDKAPYYCTLCLMRFTTKSALINHVTKYSRHRLTAAELGATNDGGYLVENPRAAELVCGRDYRKISPIEASKLFRSNGRDSVEDFPDQEGEFCHEPAQAVRAMPAVSSLPVVSNGTSGFINVQLTPEMLSNLLKNQTLQNNLFHSSLPQATSSEMSVTKTAEVPLYSPDVASVPSYTPTPIAPKTLPLLKSLPFISSANKSTSSLNPTGTAFGPPQLSMPQIVTLSEPSTCHAQTHPTSTEERQPKSTLSTPRIGNTTENLMPGILGDMYDFSSEFNFEHDWPDSPIANEQPIKTSMLPVSKGPQSTAAQITNLQPTAAQITSPQPTAAPITSPQLTAAPTTNTKEVKETVTLTCEGEPEPKRAKLDAEESKRQYEMIN